MLAFQVPAEGGENICLMMEVVCACLEGSVEMKEKCLGNQGWVVKMLGAEYRWFVYIFYYWLGGWLFRLYICHDGKGLHRLLPLSLP